MLAVYQNKNTAIRTARDFVHQQVRSGPLEAKDFFRKLSHACRDLAFEIEAGTFVWKVGWAHDNGRPDGIAGHILVRCGMPADIVGAGLARIFEDELPDLYNPLNWVEIYCNMTYVLEENKPIQKQQILRYLREASDAAGRVAAT